MRRRSVSLALVAMLTAQPVFAQAWLQRYLKEKKNRDNETEIRRAEPVNPADATTSGTNNASDDGSTTSSIVPPATTAPATDDSDVPVRRAEPVDTTAGAQPAATPEAAAPAATPAPSATPAPTPKRPAEAPVLRTEAQASPAATPPSTDPGPQGDFDPNAKVIRLTPGASTETAPDVAEINLANSYYAKKQFDMAAVEYERYLDMFPAGADRQTAYFRLAESYRQMGNMNSARKAYETLVFTYQDGDFVGPASYRLADMCFQDKDFSNALTFYHKASVRVKDPAIALSAKFYAAKCEENLNFSTDAMIAYEDVLQSQVPNNPFKDASRLSLATLYADNGRKQDALKQLALVEKESDKPAVQTEAMVRSGVLLLELNKNPQGIAELSKALKSPDIGNLKEVAELGLMRALYNDGKYLEVLDTYDNVGKEFSADALPEVLLIVANSHRQLGKYDAARELYEEAIRDYPGSVYAKEAQYERLVAMYNANAPDLLTEIDAYLAQNPEASAKRDQLILMKAEALYKQKKFAEAAPVYAQLEDADLTPTLRADALFKLAWCYSQIHQNEKAVATLTTFLSRYGTSKLAPSALAQRADAYQQMKNYAAALKDYDELLLRFPRVKEREFAYQQKALILGQEQENQAMADTFAHLLKEFPRSPAAGQANYWIGWASFEAKNYRDCIAPLEAARKLDKDYAERASLRILLAYASLEDRDHTALEANRHLSKVPSEILRWLGAEYMKADQPAVAEKYLATLTKRPDTEGVIIDDWLNLGRARTKLGRWKDAETALKQYIKLSTDPGPQATGFLALGEAQLGATELDDAQKSAEQVQTIEPEGRVNAQGRILAGDVAMARGSYEDAAKLYLSVAVVFDDPAITPQALEKAYTAYKQAGNTMQAAKVLNDLQTRYPEYPISASK